MTVLLSLSRCIFILWLFRTVACIANVSNTSNMSRLLQLEKQVADLTERLQLLEEKCKNATSVMVAQSEMQPSISNINSVPLKSCKGIFDEDSSAPSGLYRIAPCGREFTVYCDMKEDGGGWTKIQQRVDNSTDFYRNRTEYVRGFGNFESNFWLGLDNIHCLTHNEPCELLVKISIFSGDTGKSKYQYFKVGNKDSGYQLHVRGYNKTVSDGGDALEVHNRQKFTTRDHDNDKSSSDNCAIKYRGAWWYNNCYESNLNGRYYNDDENTNASDGIIWYTFTGPGYSAKSVSMAVRCTC